MGIIDGKIVVKNKILAFYYLRAILIDQNGNTNYFSPYRNGQKTRGRVNRIVSYDS